MFVQFTLSMTTTPGAPLSQTQSAISVARVEHLRGRTMTSEPIHLTAVLDNTIQVHCNQVMIELDPKQYVGGELIFFGGIPFVLCLGLS